MEVKTRDQFVSLLLDRGVLHYSYRLYARSLLDQTKLALSISDGYRLLSVIVPPMLFLPYYFRYSVIMSPDSSRSTNRLYSATSICVRAVVGANGSDPWEWIHDWIHPTQTSREYE